MFTIVLKSENSDLWEGMLVMILKRLGTRFTSATPGKLHAAIMLIALAIPFTALADSPRYVVYYNSNASPLIAAADADYTHVIVSFLTLGPESDGHLTLLPPKKMLGQWSSVARLKAAGKRVMISFGGGEMQLDDYRSAIGREKELAAQIAEFVKAKGLDGVDIDFEASPALKHPLPEDAFDGTAFLIALTNALRKLLPHGRYLITHTPQPPYLDPAWHGGGYVKVLKQVGDKIDWIAVQYYDNPSFDTPHRRTIIGEGKSPFVTSYRGIVEGRIDLAWPSDKLVVGKPIYRADAVSGHQTPESVARTIVEPLRERYGERFGGLMGWQFSTLTPDHRYWNNEMAKALGLKP